jgi:protein-disulfide isomerase
MGDQSPTPTSPWFKAVVLCAAVVTLIQVKREFFPSGDRPAEPRLVKVAGWEGLTESGHRFGPADAPVTIVTFSDFECPVCAAFTNRSLRGIREELPGEVQIIYRHWPLPYHRFALPAARAAECAGRQNRFEAYHDALFATHDSLGLIPWGVLATRAGIPDLPAFESCAAESGPIASIAADTLAVQRIGGTGTPTIVINGWRTPGAPDSMRLRKLVDSMASSIDR